MELSTEHSYTELSSILSGAILSGARSSGGTGKAIYNRVILSREQGPYVGRANISLNRVYLLSAVEIQETGIYEGHLRLSGRPRSVRSCSLILSPLSSLSS